MPVMGKFEEGLGLKGVEVRIEPGLFVPKHAKVVFQGDEAILSYVEPLAPEH